VQFYLGTTRLQLEHKGGADHIVTSIANVVPAFGFIGIPVIGWLLDRMGYGITLATINFLGVLASFFQAMPSVWFQVWCCLRCSCCMDYQPLFRLKLSVSVSYQDLNMPVPGFWYGCRVPKNANAVEKAKHSWCVASVLVPYRSKSLPPLPAVLTTPKLRWCMVNMAQPNGSDHSKSIVSIGCRMCTALWVPNSIERSTSHHLSCIWHKQEML